MSALPERMRILGYADELSVAPGEAVRFHISGDLGGQYRAQVHRLLGGGFDPRAPQLRTERLADLGRHRLLDQAVPIGSWATAAWPEPEPVPLEEATLVLTVQPTLAGGDQAVAWIGDAQGLGLVLAAEGAVVVRSGGDELCTEVVAPIGEWTTIVLSWTRTDLTLSARAGGRWRSSALPVRSAPPSATRFTLAAAPVGDEGLDHHFSGRIERPALLAGAHTAADAVRLVGDPGAPVPRQALVLWEFSRDIQRWQVPGHGTHAVDLDLRQAPVRGIRGSLWHSATDYRHSPAEYGAIHFHADALEDCGWLSQCGWTVPQDAVSGFYALHVAGGDDEDWVPFFVRPAASSARADLLVVASSATYFAYGNSRFWWEDPIQEIAQDRLVELGRQEQHLVVHPELGLSNYDRHLDGAPVVFSSRHRPNLFMRPGHSRAESYASDLYLIAWLERRGIRYDVVTDEDLHFRGREILSGYRAVASGSHPEYLSAEMFDAMASWVDEGGRYLYLGGNGFTSGVTWRADRPWLMENRATGIMQNDQETTATETIHQLDASPGRDMAAGGRAPGSLFGVDSVTMGFDRSYPLVRSDVSYAPEFAWLFDGIPSRTFGGRSLSGGGVIGQEWDNARLVDGAAGHYVLASTVDTSLIPDILGADSRHHADLVAYFRGDGLVVSASSMAWVGALHVDDYDNDAERFVRNVVTRLIDPAPLSQPEPAEVTE